MTETDMKVLTIIPARNNSKGIPGKNIVSLCGKPLIAWNILAAQKSKYVNRIVVSTDGNKIKEISENYGAEVIFRPDSISGDTASSESALMHVLSELEEQENYHPDILVFLQCTSPLTSSEDIDNCINKLIEEEADSATSVTAFHYFLWKSEKEGAQGINHEKEIRLLRQEREPQYLETGAIYVMRTDGFIKAKHRFFGKTALSLMPSNRVKEIDEPNDLIVAEAMMNSQWKDRIIEQLPGKIEVVFFDFDGVMTDDSVIVSEEGKEAVICSREDGMGISLLKKAGIKSVVLSTEKNSVVSARCTKLDIECYQNLGHNKLSSMMSYLENNKINVADTIYMGNDINDIECMKMTGFAVAPKNAHVKVKMIADLITIKEGGKGAVRELCEMVVDKVKK